MAYRLSLFSSNKRNLVLSIINTISKAKANYKAKVIRGGSIRKAKSESLL
jgi:hypothetical protein